jgi:uncharacterized damage-inducible protein DinB
MTAKQYALANLDKSHDVVLMMLKDVPVHQHAAQLPGASNHLLWTAGHLACTYPFFSAAIGGKGPELPGDYEKLFGYGSTPVADSKAYPTLEVLLGYMEKGYAAFKTAAAGLTDEQLAASALAGSGYLTTQMDALLALAGHDMWHAGQLSALRRGLGMKPAFG